MNTTALPKIASQDEWLEARKQLLIKEKELTHARDALSAARRELPMVPVEKEYVFETPSGKRSLLELFDGRLQLIVYHAMFGPDWEEVCPGCAFLLDAVGELRHLHAADTSFTVVSRAPLTKIETMRQRMGWTFPWASSYGNDFNYDYHVTLDAKVAPTEYNFEPATYEGEVPGTSVFVRDGSSVFHTYSSYARGGDNLLQTFNYLDLTPLGRQEEAGTMNWVRHHDKY